MPKTKEYMKMYHAKKKKEKLEAKQAERTAPEQQQTSNFDALVQKYKQKYAQIEAEKKAAAELAKQNANSFSIGKTEDFSKATANSFFNGKYKNEQETWQNSLTGDERVAIKSYCGSGYQAINDGLAKGGKKFKSIEEKANKIGNALDKYTLKENITVTRGAGWGMFGGLKSINELKQYVGANIKSKCFLSTSADTKAAFSGKPIILKIHVPKGSGKGAYVGNISAFTGEKEFLINKGKTFKILSVKADGGTYGQPLVEMAMID